MIGEHARDLFVIARAVTNDPETARQAVVNVMADALLRQEERGRLPDAKWLYAQAVRESRRLSRRAPARPPGPLPTDDVDRQIWPLLDTFDWRERLLCALHAALKWPDAASAALLNVSENAVQAQLAIFEQRFDRAIEQGLSSPETPEPPTGQKAAAVLATESISRRYAAPDLSSEELAGLLEQARQAAASRRRALRGSSPLRWLVIGGAGLLVIGICLAASLFAGLNVFSPRPAATPGPTPFGTSLAPAGETPRARPLNWLSSSDTIRRRLQESASQWETLYVDVQMIEYGPSSYVGASRNYRAQAWVKQPDESIQLFGLLSQDPSSTYVLTGGRSYAINPILNRSSSRELTAEQEVPPAPQALIENAGLRAMIFPSIARWAAQDGTFRVYNTGRILERDALVVDWYNTYGQRETRLWLDAGAGIVLRLQEFGGPDFKLLLSDFTVTEIAYDQSFPPSRLASAMQTVGASSPRVEPSAPRVILPTPTLAVGPERRASLPPDPAPAGFDPALSRLTFQFPNNLQFTNVQTGTALAPVQLFADHFWIAETKFGLPWLLRCQRSSDGYRLAFNTGTDGASVPDDSLRWLDLRDPQKLYAPLPNLHVDDFTFSADGAQVALFGRGDLPGLDGVYLVELATGESRKVISLSEAHSLVWSPDGESLALVGVLDPDSGQEAALIHLRTGQISFHTPFPSDTGQPPEDWPMSNWGVPFPRSMGGMDDCARPPQS